MDTFDEKKTEAKNLGLLSLKDNTENNAKHGVVNWSHSNVTHICKTPYKGQCHENFNSREK